MSEAKQTDEAASVTSVRVEGVVMQAVEYLRQHHAICETGIGLARLHLKNGDHERAIKALDDASDKIDDAIRKYQPETAKLMGLTA